MSVLVTGGAGYVGSHVVLELLAAGEKVVVVDNLSTGFKNNVDAGAELVVGDVGHASFMSSLLGSRDIQTIFHFAGSIVVPESISDPLAYYCNNTVNTFTLIAAAVTQKIPHFIFSSTAAVYGVPIKLPVAECAQLLPISPYGSSKLMSELMLADTARAHPLRFVALRYFNVAGADPVGRSGQSNPRSTHLIKVACQSILTRGREIPVFGTDYPTSDGTCIRDYIHVSDLAAAHLSALRYLRSGGRSRALNCGYGHGYSVREVIQSVRRVSGVDVQERVMPRRAGDPAELVARIESILSELDWRPRLDDLDTIVSHAIRWEASLNLRSVAGR